MQGTHTQQAFALSRGRWMAREPAWQRLAAHGVKPRALKPRLLPPSP